MLRIQIQNLVFSREGRRVLDGVTLNVRDGEYVCLLGANGSGKSTLLSCLNGLERPPLDACRVFDSQGAAFDCAREDALPAVRQITGTVTQNPEHQIICPVVEEDAAFTPEQRGLSPQEAGARARAALKAAGIYALRRRRTDELSGGEKQRLAIAGVLAAAASVLLLDEPDSMLDAEEKTAFNALLKTLAAEGKTILRVTHSPKDAREADRCVLLAAGAIVYDGSADGLPPPFSLAPPPQKPPEQPAFRAGGPRALAFWNVSFGYPGAAAGKDGGRVEDVSFALPAGASAALTGPSGGGKSTLLQLAGGLFLPERGAVFVEGRDTAAKTALRARAFRAALAVQNPEDALFETFVCDDVAYGPRNKGLKGRALREAVRAAMDSAGLPFDTFASRKTSELSGGEKRRCALAGVLAMDAGIYLLDEPDCGLDKENADRVAALIERLAAEGKTVLTATHSPDLAARQDSILPVSAGRVTAPASCRLPEKAAPEIPRKGRRRRRGGPAFGGAINSLFQERPSALRRLPAGRKIVLFLLAACAALAAPHPLVPLCAACLTLLCAKFLGGVGPRLMLRPLLPLLPFALILAAFQFFFDYESGAVAVAGSGVGGGVLIRAGRWTLTQNEAASVAKTVFKCLAVMNLLTLYLAVTRLRETLAAIKRFLRPLERRGLPAEDILLVLSITARFVPVFCAEARRIYAAHVARGAPVRGIGRVWTTLALIKPLFLRALERSQTLAAAIVLRSGNPCSK